MEQIILAGGCFWGVQYYFDHVPGVVSTTAGYTGGTTENPTYEDVCSHTTGHAEAVLIEYDTAKVSTETIIKQFFRMHDPTQLNRQGPDVGDNYRSAIYYVTDEQKEIAEKVIGATQEHLKEPIVTQLEPAGPFYRAEDYHQKYTEKTGRGACHTPYERVD